jgi:hypothetical protein
MSRHGRQAADVPIFLDRMKRRHPGEARLAVNGQPTARGPGLLVILESTAA